MGMGRILGHNYSPVCSVCPDIVLIIDVLPV